MVRQWHSAWGRTTCGSPVRLHTFPAHNDMGDPDRVSVTTPIPGTPSAAD